MVLDPGRSCIDNEPIWSPSGRPVSIQRKKEGILWLGKVRAAMSLQLCVVFLYPVWASCFKDVS